MRPPKTTGVEVRLVLRRNAEGLFEVDGKSVRVRPSATTPDVVMQCIAAVEKWAKVVNRRMRIDSSIAPKITEAVQNAGVHIADQVTQAAGRMIFEKFFAPKTRDE